VKFNISFGGLVIRRVEKPWGFEEVLLEEPYLVKRLVLKDETSTHYHTVKTEHLFTVRGEGVVYLDGNVFPMVPNSVCRVDRGVKHKIVPKDFLDIIEVSDVNVEDTVRIANKHGRT
jgi:mannose-6-phosphate isomerase-like protein (cupin superfamily)